ncbi:MAG TPA: transcription elongation factor GreA [Spirochaetota bacterium]|nr:transcription elongation factor GreA [Spirochaetota bacterium]
MSNDIEKQKQQIKEELDALKYEFTFELPKKISEAREHGDLKENADYHAARERQGFVRAKIAQLSEQLARLNNIDVKNISEDSVGFGSKVVVVDTVTNAKTVFMFVPDGEMNPSEGKITLSTPYGRAMVGKKVGETVTVTIPAGKKIFRIVSLVTIHGNEINE